MGLNGEFFCCDLLELDLLTWFDLLEIKCKNCQFVPSLPSLVLYRNMHQSQLIFRRISLHLDLNVFQIGFLSFQLLFKHHPVTVNLRCPIFLDQDRHQIKFDHIWLAERIKVAVSNGVAKRDFEVVLTPFEGSEIWGTVLEGFIQSLIYVHQWI